jgi:hypothetical protein
MLLGSPHKRESKRKNTKKREKIKKFVRKTKKYISERRIPKHLKNS